MPAGFQGLCAMISVSEDCLLRALFSMFATHDWQLIKLGQVPKNVNPVIVGVCVMHCHGWQWIKLGQVSKDAEPFQVPRDGGQVPR
jgi:hypothetical protein